MAMKPEPVLALSEASAYARAPVIEMKSKNERPDPALLHGALIPVAAILAAVVYYGIGLAFGTMLIVIAPFLILFAAAPIWARQSTQAFDRDSMGLLAAGEHDELQRRLASAWGMRLFASPTVTAERRGRIANERGDFETAYAGFERASRGYRNNPPISVVLGLANACFLLERDSRDLHCILEEGHFFHVRKVPIDSVEYFSHQTRLPNR